MKKYFCVLWMVPIVLLVNMAPFGTISNVQTAEAGPGQVQITARLIF